MYQVHWKTTDMIGGKLVAVTVPAMNAFSATPLRFGSASAAHEWARKLFRECGCRFAYTVKAEG